MAKVTLDAARALFKDLGYDAEVVNSWSITKITEKVNGLPGSLKGKKPKKTDTKKTLAAIIASRDEDEDVKVVGGKPGAKPAKGSAGKPGKKKARDEDDEEDDDDEEEQEEDEAETEDDDDDAGDDDDEDGDADDEDDTDDEAEEDEEVSEDDEADDDSEDEESDDEESEEDEDEDSDDETDDDEEDEVAATAKKPGKKGGGKPSKNGKPVKKGGGAAFQSAGRNGSPGVIDSIIEFLCAASARKPLSKEDIHEKLKKRFKERSADSMWTTINIQVPSRLKADRGVIVKKNENGYWIEALPAKKKVKK